MTVFFVVALLCASTVSTDTSAAAFAAKNAYCSKDSCAACAAKAAFLYRIKVEITDGKKSSPKMRRACGHFLCADCLKRTNITACPTCGFKYLGIDHSSS